MLWKYLITLGVSMVPLIELRGAIPIAAGMGLDLIPSYVISVIGNLIPIPFILIFVKLVLDFMKRHGILVGLVEWVEKKAIKGADRINRGEEGDPSAAEADGARRVSRRELGALLGLYLFVAIPLPGTGAWTGSLIAALLGMNRWRAFAAVALGVLTAGVIMALASFGVLGALKLLF